MRNTKRNIVIVISIIILIIALVVCYLYFKTDMFVSNKQLFLRYLSTTEVVDNNIIQKFEDLVNNINNSNYSSNGNLEYSIISKDEETNIDNINKVFSLKYNNLKNINFNQEYADFTVNSNNEDILTVRYLRDNDIYGIKMENVLRKYIALENTNLKDFFTKLEVKNSSYIPNKISISNFKEIFKLNDIQKEKIKNTYFNILIDNIDNNKFTKSKDKNNLTTISLSLSEKEFASILVKELNALKNDTESLNLIINKAKIVDYNLNIDSLKTAIQEEIDKINNNNNTNEEFIRISLVENNKKIIKYIIKMHVKDIKENNEKKELNFSIDLSQNHNIIFDIKNNENNIRSNITYGYEQSGISLNIDTVLLDNQNNKTSDLFKIIYQITQLGENNIENNTSITYYSNGENEKHQISIKGNKKLKQDIQIEKMTTENMELLNEKSKEELKQLIEAIIGRITYVYGEESKTYTAPILQYINK